MLFGHSEDDLVQNIEPVIESIYFKFLLNGLQVRATFVFWLPSEGANFVISDSS